MGIGRKWRSPGEDAGEALPSLGGVVSTVPGRATRSA